jgi:hypothetical protein
MSEGRASKTSSIEAVSQEKAAAVLNVASSSAARAAPKSGLPIALAIGPAG